jgi:hypothetical protein
MCCAAASDKLSDRYAGVHLDSGAGGVKTLVRFIASRRPRVAIDRAIFALASSIISSPSMTAPTDPPAAEV